MKNYLKNSVKFTIACFVVILIGVLSLLGQQAFAEAGMAGCSKECGSCQKSCEKASAYLKTKGASAASATAQTNIADCIELCKTSQALIEKNSKYHPAICKVCAEACSACAKSCEALNDPKLKECIQECKTCAASCKQMAG